MRRRVRLTERELRNMISESVNRILNEEISEDMNQYVPKKAFRMIDKVNNELRQLKELTGDEYPELLDTSTGAESFYAIVSDVVIENGHMKWYEKEPYSGKIHVEDWNLIRKYDGEEDYWFDDDDFKDQVSYLRSGIKKATKYFKEYNPDWDDDENKHERFIDSL